ncbi:MAG: FtsX-like permease family protein, partial [Nitrospirota bacterium]
AVRTANIEVLHSFEQAVLTVAGPTTLEVSGGDFGLDERLITKVREVPGLIAASPVIAQTAVRLDTGKPGSAVQVIGLDLLAEFESRGFRVAKGATDNPLVDLLKADSLYIGRKLAAEWHLERGSTVQLQVGPRQVQARIAGVIQDQSDRVSSWDHLAVMDIAAVQVLFGMVGKLDRIDLVTSPEAEIDAAAQAVRAVVPPHVTVERPTSRTRQVEQMVRAFRLNLTVLSWVGLLVGMFLIYNTMAFAVAQRRREIGIYRAIGMTQSRVAGLFLAEAALFGLLGGIVGSAGGILLAQKLVTLVSRTISDLYTPVSQGVSSWFDSAELWQASVEGILIGCLVSMIGAIGPSLDASRTATVRALAPGDYESSRQVRVGGLAVGGIGLLVLAGLLAFAGPLGGVPILGYLATFCLLAGLSCLAPLCITGWKKRALQGEHLAGIQGAMREIAVEHAARNPGRNGVTVSALMVGLAIMIGVLIMVRSFRHTVEVWINETVIADIVVAPSTWLREANSGNGAKSLPPSWRNALAAIPGVTEVDTYRDVRVEVKGQRVAIVSRDLRLHARRSQYLVRQGNSTDLLNQAVDRGGVVVSEVLANRLGVREGHSLEIMTPQG